MYENIKGAIAATQWRPLTIQQELVMSIQSLTSTTVSTTLSAPPETSTLARSASTKAPTTTSPLPEKKTDAQPQISEAQLQDAVNAANDFIKPINNALEFSLDKDSHEMIVKVVDSATKEVIRQFPSEEMLALAQALDKIQGLLIKQKA
jgi:flagellar protein FlaG